MSAKTITVYHGTSKQDAESILKEGFNRSKGDDHWLGDGVYFFTDKLCTEPEQNAKEWAIAGAWDKKDKAYRYDEGAVLKVELQLDEYFLDFGTTDGLLYFKALKEAFISTFNEKNPNKNPFFRGEYLDGAIINFSRKKNDLIRPYLNIIFGNVYIKNVADRKSALNSRIPNSSIAVVYDLSKIISKSISLNFHTH